MMVKHELESADGLVTIRYVAELTRDHELSLREYDVLQRESKGKRLRLTRAWRRIKSDTRGLKSDGIEIIDEKPRTPEPIINALLQAAKAQIVWSDQ